MILTYLLSYYCHIRGQYLNRRDAIVDGFTLHTLQLKFNIFSIFHLLHLFILLQSERRPFINYETIFFSPDQKSILLNFGNETSMKRNSGKRIEWTMNSSNTDDWWICAHRIIVEYTLKIASVLKWIAHKHTEWLANNEWNLKKTVVAQFYCFIVLIKRVITIEKWYSFSLHKCICVTYTHGTWSWS